ncbi:hypothetical protein [Rhodohalobacter sulfatireducens]|uniref:Glycosyltransferase family 1 protein n=1 Tax=Rhodohalobacter sulfatireducens TaxID=2911366 RepID=A0ABS9KIZ9_9BACT|nr:hypothetical protein [Rhodohalobacter sulfatireducens]MCG2590821.1 hypothetical protein [Rhodohalobacter sulfatireducens]
MNIIDVLIPYEESRKRKLPFFKASFFDAISSRDWYPVIRNRSHFKDYGFEFRFFTPKNLPDDKNPNCIIIDSAIKRGKNMNWDIVKNLIRRFKKEGRTVVLFDSKDSHNMLMELLPLVDFYMKKQFLKNRMLYNYALEGGRLFTDYYSKESKGLEWNPKKNRASVYKDIFKANKDKLRISWNILMAIDEFRTFRDYIRFFSSKTGKINYIDPNKRRKIKLNANFSTSYESELVALQRIHLKKILDKEGFASGNSTGIVPKEIYKENLKNSKAVVSPFGWGEVCYRDFESFISGTALIKPDMQHIDTWPDLYEPNKTYLQISWDKNQWGSEIDKLLNDESLLLKVATTGQEKYRKIWTPSGQKKFCERFSSQLTEFINN